MPSIFSRSPKGVVETMSRFIERPWFVASASAMITAVLFLTSGVGRNTNLLPICLPFWSSPANTDMTLQLESIVHYATSTVVPQQNLAEIRVTFDVLRRRAPCNFLVFGMGHDSVMWASLNPGGSTLFLEEDPKWFETVLNQGGPNVSLSAHVVRYRTRLADADRLLGSYRRDPACDRTHVKGSSCELALSYLPEEVYGREWDLITIDAPKGYFPEAPGRMAAIYSAAVMARNRRGSGDTDVFLHDVDRKVESVYAAEFLCQKFLVGKAGRLWHFRIPADTNNSATKNGEDFC